MIIQLSKRFQYEDRDITEIDLPVTNISPRMTMAADREMVKRGIVVPMNSLDKTYSTIVASKLTKIPEDVLTALPYEDWLAITGAVQYFLLNGRAPATTLSDSEILEAEFQLLPESTYSRNSSEE